MDPATITRNLLTDAIELHRAGRLAQAAQLYAEILSHDQANTEALHLLGVVYHQQGNSARAVQLICQAVALRPSIATYHSNLAEAYRAQGEFERAVGCCRAALRLSPDYPEALSNLGLALQELGRHEDAIAHFRRALELAPDFAPAISNLGLALRDQGNLEEALACLQHAVELDPGHAAARSNLGQLLLSCGRAEEALLHFQQAVRFEPNIAVLHHNLGNALRILSRLAEARKAYLEALRLDPDLALSHAHFGLILQREGQLGDALISLKQAVCLEPKNAASWVNLAELHGELQEQEQAIACAEQAVVLAPTSADARLALGWALQEAGRLVEAGEQYSAVAGTQADSAVAQLNIGGLCEELGQLNRAENAFRAALRLQPEFALAHARLATLLRGKLPDADLGALQVRLMDPQLEPGHRARLLFALAHVMDARGDYTGASDSLRQANALTLELARGQRDYEPARHEQFVDGLLQAFDGNFFARFRGAGLPTRRPVFVFGLPRSGTTLVEQVLASHSLVHGAGEIRLVRQTFEAIPAALNRAPPVLAALADVDAGTVHRLAERHLARLRAIDDGRAERIVDKMPDNYLYLGLVALLFPQAVLIHCRRNLRDVALSCWMTDFRSIRWANAREHIASRFQQYRRLMDHWRHLLPVPLYEVRYEELVTDPEPSVRRLVAACGLDWEAGCLDFHRSHRPIRTASMVQVRHPMYTHSVSRWKNYQADLGDLFGALPGD